MFSTKFQDKNHLLNITDQKLDQAIYHRQKKNSFALFHKMAKKIRAYSKFLRSHHINPTKIKTLEDLAKVPSITKKNYFNIYPIREKVWPYALSEKLLIGTSTSGSTGKPTYFLRSDILDEQYSYTAEYFLSHGPKGPTLLIDCFGMGIWIGGLITYQAFYDAAKRGSALSIITPGINKKEIFNSLRELAPTYKNLIFTGYPPFIKDIIDESQFENINLKKYNCRFLFAAESFTENFRDYIVRSVGVKNLFTDTMNIYGTAEFGAMAHETPTSILIRRLALSNPQIQTKIFNRNSIPTFAQYNSEFIAFDEIANELLITANSAMPACRYQIGDNGGVTTLSELMLIFKEHGINLVSEANKHNIKLCPLPFVYVFERSDFSVTLYGLQIYPQSIKRAMENRYLHKNLTGKFSMETAYDQKSNQYLKINIELKPQVKPTSKLYTTLLKLVIKRLLLENSEYRELAGMLESSKTRPKLVFWPYNDATYFKSGIKQQWFIK